MAATVPPATADEAMDMVRAGLGYLAQLPQADVATLPAVTQARLLRELERAGSQHTAARARLLSVFDGQCLFRDDGHGGTHPWLTAQTRVSAKAASGSMSWMHRVQAHPIVGEALAAGAVSESYARKIYDWSAGLPDAFRDIADQILCDAAAAGADLGDLAGLAEDMYARAAPPDTDSAREQRRFRDRFFRVTRLFQGHGRADGDLTPQCLAAVQEVLDTLGRKAGPEDDRTAGQRRHDALEEACRLLLASGCLPQRAGQPALVQLHLGLDELLSMPGAADAARQWLTDHLAASQPGDDPPGDAPGGTRPGTDPAGSAPGGSQPGADPAANASQGPGSGPAPARRDPFEILWPDPHKVFSRPDPRAGRRDESGTGETGWLTGTAADAYSCDAKIAPMVCGHLDRNVLARITAALLPGPLATGPGSVPAPQPRCACDVHGAIRPAPIPGELLATGPPGHAASGPAQPGAAAAPGGLTLTPGGLARLQDTITRYALSLLSGPAGLAAHLRTQLTSGYLPSASLPLDLGEPTEQVPPHLRRAVIKRDRHCSFPGCTAPPVRCHAHHVIPRSNGGVTRLDNLTLLCHFHHLIAVHRWGWTLTLHADGTTTATSPEGLRTLHSHGPPPGQKTLWADPPERGSPGAGAANHSPPASAA